MTKGQIINLIFIILGIAGCFYGLYSILYKSLKRKIEQDIIKYIDKKI